MDVERHKKTPLRSIRGKGFIKKKELKKYVESLQAHPSEKSASKTRTRDLEKGGGSYIPSPEGGKGEGAVKGG